MILDRQQFVDHYDNIKSGLGQPDSPLWAWELSSGFRGQWFVLLEHSRIRRGHDDYWAWCEHTLQGQTACYSAGEDGTEWWGFSHRPDILPWLLRWS